MKILVDSSVWIEYFRKGNDTTLDTLLTEDLAITNSLILCELVPVLVQKKQITLIESLKSLHKQRLIIDWDIINEYQIDNLKNGINKVGVPDLIILQQVIENNLTLYSFDNHFRLMKKIFHFNLIS